MDWTSIETTKTKIFLENNDTKETVELTSSYSVIISWEKLLHTFTLLLLLLLFITYF